MCVLSAELVVCQLSVVKPVGQSVGRLYLTRFQRGLAPLITCLPGFETAEVPIRRDCLHSYILLLISRNLYTGWQKSHCYRSTGTVYHSLQYVVK